MLRWFSTLCCPGSVHGSDTFCPTHVLLIAKFLLSTAWVISLQNVQPMDILNGRGYPRNVYTHMGDWGSYLQTSFIDALIHWLIDWLIHSFIHIRLLDSRVYPNTISATLMLKAHRHRHYTRVHGPWTRVTKRHPAVNTGSVYRPLGTHS